MSEPQDKEKPINGIWSHDVIRSGGVIVSVVLALVSLGVASTSLWLQLNPKPERISIDVPELVATPDAFQTRVVGPLPSGSHSLVGPFVWKVTVSNESDRAVSFIHLETRLQDGRADEYFVSGQDAGAARENDSSPVFPFVIPAYESKSLLVRGFLPGFLGFEAQAKCLKKGTTPAEYNQCAINTGIDIFGNKLTLYRNGDQVTGASWPSPMYQPAYVMRFTSSTGKIWIAQATVFPAYMPIAERPATVPSGTTVPGK